MLADLVLSIMMISLAFSVGFATRRASICAVTAARQSATGRRHSRMIAFLTAACWSGVVLMSATSLAPELAPLSPGYPVTLTVIAGGALFGLGAYINGACAFGTLSHLAGGDLNYIGTLIGIAGGAAVSALLPVHPGAPVPATLSPGSGSGLYLFLLFAVSAAAATRKYVRTRLRHAKPSVRRLGAAPALLILGAGGALLHAVAGEWTYMAVLSDRAARLVSGDASEAGGMVLAGTAALIAGGIYAARRSGRFRWKRPMPYKFITRISGGAMMSLAAANVPGGNDVLLLYGIPSVAPHAIAAYGAMMVVLLVIFRIKESRRYRAKTNL